MIMYERFEMTLEMWFYLTLITTLGTTFGDPVIPKTVPTTLSSPRKSMLIMLSFGFGNPKAS